MLRTRKRNLVHLSHFSFLFSPLSSLFILHRPERHHPHQPTDPLKVPFRNQDSNTGPRTVIRLNSQQENNSSRLIPSPQSTSPPSQQTDITSLLHHPSLLHQQTQDGIRTRFRIPQGRPCDVDHPRPSGFYYPWYHVPEQLLGVSNKTIHYTQ